jgi:hypothetical protein
MTTQRDRVIYAAVSVLMSVVLSCGFAVFYVTEQNKKWCDTLGALTATSPLDRPKPSTPSGVVQQQQQYETWLKLVRVRDGFHCSKAANQ